jgi:hypothetical protein
MTTADIIRRPHILGHYLGYTKLSAVHSTMIRYVWKKNMDRVILAFRGAYKTTAIVVVGTIWYLLFNPDARILICREEAGGAAATLGEIQRQYETAAMAALYDDLFGISDFRLRDASGERITLPTKTKITKEGSIEGIGVGGSSTGRHYDVILTDDIVTLKDRVSRAKRDLTKNFVRELKNVVNPEGAIKHSGTVWHREDAFSILPTAKRYPLGTIPVEGLTSDKVADIKKRTTSSLFAAQYELKHLSDEDRIFGEAKYCQWNRDAFPVIWIDPAYSGTNTTALAMAYVEGGRIFARGFVWRRDITSLYAEITSLAKGYNASKIIVETNADKGLSLLEIQKYFPIAVGHYERDNKHMKIVSYLKKHWSDVYIAEDSQTEFVAQVLDYAEGEEPDDAADALASLIREIVYNNNMREARVF